ncbi:hypothetical protein [Aurantibacillus circumpalustris]|uniref:hypothetical protein n=1 Tax=Aurantibacillus circumpalustris TaxID=3036359 RepID=UPI00295B63E2|nr:hypothetical protein [Aurantibacillus circumpalustris]
MKRSINFTALCLCLLNFTSCKKGETGPQGKDGSSNVQSYTQTAVNSSWTYNNSENSYDVTFTVPAITEAVVNGGTIQVFLGIGTTTTQWAAMPFAYGNTQYNYDYQLGKVNIYVTLGNGNTPDNPGGLQFKVVVIPPASKSALPDNSGTNVQTETIFSVG